MPQKGKGGRGAAPRPAVPKRPTPAKRAPADLRSRGKRLQSGEGFWDGIGQLGDSFVELWDPVKKQAVKVKNAFGAGYNQSGQGFRQSGQGFAGVAHHVTPLHLPPAMIKRR
jgi:hypothetical protein